MVGVNDDFNVLDGMRAALLLGELKVEKGTAELKTTSTGFATLTKSISERGASRRRQNPCAIRHFCPFLPLSDPSISYTHPIGIHIDAK